MIGDWIKGMMGAGKRHRAPLERFWIDQDGPIYAIGDVHGQAGLLKALEAKILADGKAYSGDKLIILLGDLIDRGPRSAQVLDHCLSPLPAGWWRMSLCGNHEISMLDGLDDRKVLKTWLGYGGVETLASYGIGHPQLQDALKSQHKLDMMIGAHIPSEHVAFLRSLPVMIETQNFVFAHAGLNPGLAVQEQTDDDLMWYHGPRDDGPTRDGRTVVHGHIIVEEPVLEAGRINIDLGAYMTGRLACVRLVGGEPPAMIIHERTATGSSA